MTVVCKNCGTVKGFIEEKGTQTGLYCNKCGKWIKWLNKEEVRLFNHNNEYSEREELKTHKEYDAINKESFDKGYNKAIDDFAEQLSIRYTILEERGYAGVTFEKLIQNVFEYAEQLKGGASNE